MSSASVNERQDPIFLYWSLNGELRDALGVLDGRIKEANITRVQAVAELGVWGRVATALQDNVSVQKVAGLKERAMSLQDHHSFNH